MEKHKALIITILLMGIFILGLININMLSKQKAQSEILMEIPEDFLAQQEEEEDEEPAPKEDRKLIASKRTHSAFNEDFENSKDIEQRIKSISEKTESEKVEEPPEDDQPALEKIVEKKPKLEPKETNNRNTSLSYSLRGRKRIELPNPVYTCNGSGKVVVKIEVNQNGYVMNTKIDKKKSTTRNECLFDNAMEYARKALFSRSKVDKQLGSITYYFNYGS